MAVVSTVRLARTLDNDEVARLLDVDGSVVRRWAAIGVIPEAFITEGGPGRGNKFRFAPVVVALGLLIADLSAKLKSPKSPIPFLVAKQIAPRLAQAWHESLPIRLTIEFEDDTSWHFGHLDVIRRAQEKIASLAA
jgi:hypothetical protein